MTTARTKLLTDSVYAKTNPDNESQIRSVVDGSIQEVFDNLNTGKAEQSDFVAHKTSSDHDGRYYTETEVNALLTAITVGGLSPDSITDTYLKQTGSNIVPNFNLHLTKNASDGVHGLDSSIAKFKTGSSTYTDNDTSQTFTDAFCTASSLVVVSITGTTPQGTWSVTSGAGSFTITSTVAESADVTFDYYITKVV